MNDNDNCTCTCCCCIQFIATYFLIVAALKAFAYFASPPDARLVLWDLEALSRSADARAVGGVCELIALVSASFLCCCPPPSCLRAAASAQGPVEPPRRQRRRLTTTAVSAQEPVEPPRRQRRRSRSRRRPTTAASSTLVVAPTRRNTRALNKARETELKEPRQLYEEAEKMDDEVRKRELYRRAIEKLDALIDREPDNANMYYERGQCKLAIAKGSTFIAQYRYFVEDALKDYQACFEKDRYNEEAAKMVDELPELAERWVHEKRPRIGAGLFRLTGVASTVGSETEREIAGGVEGLDLDNETGGGGSGSSCPDRHCFLEGF